MQTWRTKMRRGGFYAILSLGVVVPTAALALAATRPGVRAFASSFFAPIPRPPAQSRDAGVTELAVEPLTFGVESPELAALASGDAGAPVHREPRRALFASAVPKTRGERPPGVARTSLASRDDEGVNARLASLPRDNDARAAIAAAVRRSGRYRFDVERVFRAWKLPDELLAVVFVESGFSPTAVATDSGAGLWSLPIDVAQAYGLVTSRAYDERRSVEVSSEGAAHYLVDLRERLGSWELALYAFGNGYASTMAALNDKKEADFWKLARELPAENVGYVQDVLAVATVLGNLDRFGFEDVHLDERTPTSDMEIPAGTSLGTVARAAGTTKERLRDLNPEYLGEVVPNTGFAMIMHLPSAGLARAKELLMPLLYATPGSALSRSLAGNAHEGDASVDAGAAVATPALRPGREGRSFVKVQDGDTLDSLAQRFHTDRETIASDNSLDSSAPLRAGQLLTIRSSSERPSLHATP